MSVNKDVVLREYLETTRECCRMVFVRLVLSYGVVCCHVLQRVAVGCSGLQWVAVGYSGLQLHDGVPGGA